MVKLNQHYRKLSDSYLFPEIDRRVQSLKKEGAPLINLGIGDVTRPLPPAIVQALSLASKEMGDLNTFKGYGPSQGYLFLREAIATHDYAGLKISADEIFVSDGAKCDLGNIQEIFALENRVALPDPTYPVYLDTTVMAGRSRPQLKTGRYGGVCYLPCTEENGFCPEPPNAPSDLIYLCSPNNPTGAAMERKLLERWVEYARANHAVIIFDGAYEAYITSPGVPKSIYEIPGADRCALEIRSFSKTAGFTGLRCSYTVVPRALTVMEAGTNHSLHALWKRRHETKFGGVPYPIQKAAAAIYSPEGKEQVKEIVATYGNQARFLKLGLEKLGYTVFGGTDAPYVWCKAPGEMSSWDFFDKLLNEARVVSIPGRGFGHMGEGFVRFSAFAKEELLAEALERIAKL